MSKTKKVLLLIIGLLIVALSFTGASYAMWQVNHSQSDENIVNVGCFETSTDLGTNLENSAINLDKHFPISDVQGMNLTPFTFTVTNTCTSVANFQVNLETLSTSNIGKQYIKVAINNTKSILNNLDSVEKTLDTASSSNMLESGTLYPGQSITFDIRLWVDEATTVEDLGADEAGTNLIYAAKVTLATSARMYNDTAVDTLMKLVSGEANNTIDVIEKSAPDGAICTNTLAYDNTVDNNLRYVGANPCNYVCFNNECPTQSEVYMMYADGDISTGAPRFYGKNNYDSEEACQQQALGGNAQSLGSATFTCVLDSSTNKYYVEAHGYLNNYSYSTIEECESGLSSNGLKSSTTPSGLSCRTNTVTTGGWRIIGLMNNVDDGTGKKEQRVKLIRNDSLGNYSWDASETSINDASGINQWGPSGEYLGADLMQELNGDYLNYNLTSNPMWYGYDGSNFGQNIVFDRTKALSASAQSLIGDAVWYTGAYNDTSVNVGDVIAKQMYINERSSNPNATNNGKYCTSVKYCNDTVTRTYTWTGKVALINMSDYIYATSGGTTLNRSNCLTTSVSTNNYWKSNDCSQNSWINNGSWQWSLSPAADLIGAYNVGVVSSGYVADDGVNNNRIVVRPSVYLLSDVKITGGNGSAESPYIFEK